jgi:peptide deformylase
MPKSTGFHIIQYPNEVLRQVSEEVDFGPDTVDLANRLQVILSRVNGFAVAAPQIGVSKRAFSYHSKGFRGVLFNPQITDESEEQWIYPEGCLSLPGKYFKLARPRHIKVTGFNSRGEERTFDLSDLQARIFQHEIDHLNGVMVIDHLVQNEQ